MGFENANYIAELVIENPLTNTDSVTEGSAHLRQNKRVMKNQFPNFVGTTASPKSVTLSEDQINDAALKGAAYNAFTGDMTIGGTLGVTGAATFEGIASFGNGMRLTGQNFVMEADRSLRALNSSGEERRIAYLRTSDDVMIFGEPQGTHPQANSYAGSSWAFVIGGNESFRLIPRANGAAQVADSAGTFGNVAAVHKAQTFAQQQTYQASSKFEAEPTNDLDAGVVLSASVPMISWEQTGASAGNKVWDVVAFGEQLRVRVASDVGGGNVNALTFDRNGVSPEKITAFFGSDAVVESASRNNGSLLVYDRNGAAKKAGFRNPTTVNKTTSGALTQDDEGRLVRVLDSTTTVEIPALEIYTTMRVWNNRSVPITLLRGSSLAQLELADGNTQTGNFAQLTLAAKSIAELYWYTSDRCLVFGNGLS